MAVTKGGVYHDLMESTYSISLNGIEYFFSSRLYKKMFVDRYLKNRIEYRYRIHKMLIEIDVDTLADLALYNIIEKRGFRVRIKGRDMTWQEAQKYALETKT